MKISRLDELYRSHRLEQERLDRIREERMRAERLEEKHTRIEREVDRINRAKKLNLTIGRNIDKRV